MADTHTFELPTKATIAECGPVLASLRQLIEENNDITVMCDKVEQTDLAMLQVLISAWKTAERDNKRFAVVADQDGTFDATLREYGVRLPRTTDRN